jgi:hypothetical protein
VIDEFEIRLVDECRWPERRLTSVVPELASRHHPQLAIDQGKERVYGARTSIAPGRE